jgi:predicted RNA-binding Zn ribbon-like protein
MKKFDLIVRMGLLGLCVDDSRPGDRRHYYHSQSSMTGEKNSDVVADPQPGGRAPAPGELALAQAFMNTRWDLARGRPAEMLVSAYALHDWLRTRGLLRGPMRLTNRDLDRALAVREGLRGLAFANNGHRWAEGALDAMRQASKGAGIEIYVELDGPRFVADPTTGIEGAIAALLAITARAMIDGSWQRLKACPGRHCGWAFYDHSRNQSGRWCSMKVCGERDKARAYYQRKTARQAGTIDA